MVPTNDFLPFATGGGANVESQGDYAVDGQRPIGNQPGIARSDFVNKTLRQAAWIASSLAQFLSNRTGDDVFDDANLTNILATMADAWPVIDYPSNTYYDGYHDNTNAWASSSATYADPSTVPSPAVLTQSLAQGLTVTTAAGNLPGITFTPASASHIYMITALVALVSPVGVSAVGSVKLTTGAVDICKFGDVELGASGNGLAIPVSLSGIFAPAVATPVTVKLQIAQANGGNTQIAGLLGNSIEWKILRIK